MFARLGRLIRRGPHGGATLEYAAAFALVLVVVGGTAVTARASAPVYGDIVDDAICKVQVAVGMVGSCVGSADKNAPTLLPHSTDPTDPTDPSRPTAPRGSNPPTDPTKPQDSSFDPKPKRCKVTEHGEKMTTAVKIFSFKLGETSGFVQAIYSDGTVTYTAIDGVSVGAEGGFGAKFDVGKIEGGARVNFGAGVSFNYGSTWTFKNIDEAKVMRQKMDAYLAEQEKLISMPGYTGDPKFRDPQYQPSPPSQSVTLIETTADVAGKVGLSLPWDNDPNAKSGIPNLKLADAGVKFGTTGRWTQIHDTENGTTTYTTEGEGFGQASGNLGPMSGELKGVLGSSMAITRDVDNNIVRMALVSTREGKATEVR